MKLISRFLAPLVWLFLVVIALVWLAISRTGDDWWFGTVLMFGPRWVWLMPLAVLLPLVLWLRRPGLLLPLAVAAAIVAVPVMSLVTGLQRKSGGLPPDVRVITYNVGGDYSGAKPALDEIVRLIKIARADVIVLQECGFSQDELQSALPGFQANSNVGSCLLTRFPIVTLDLRKRADIWQLDGSGVIDRFEIASPRGIFSVLNLHLETVRSGLERVRAGDSSAPSALRSNIEERRIESRVARAWSDRAKVPQIIAGDFNMPTESAIFRRFWGDLGEAWSKCGRGYGYTKYTNRWGIRIDHVLYDSNWECVDAVVDKSMGGDHRPLIVDLRFR